MIKKFLKALLMGLREIKIFRIIGTLFVVVGWLPILITLIITFFKINLTEGEWTKTIIILGIVSFFISGFISHCIEAMRYQEKNGCNFSEAWNVTDYTPEDEFF